MNEFIYVRVIWAHAHTEEPNVMLYEARAFDLSVKRRLEIFSNGKIIREAIGDDPQMWVGGCLCEGKFEYPIKSQISDTDSLFAYETTREEFEAAYSKAEPRIYSRIASRQSPTDRKF